MTETIDTAALRALAEAAKGWMPPRTSSAWAHPEYEGVALFGVLSEDETQFEIGQVETGIYDQDDAALQLARYIAASSAETVLALLDRLAAAEARNATLTDDAARLDWLTFHLPGKALRDIGVVWAEHGDARRAIDAAMKEKTP